MTLSNQQRQAYAKQLYEAELTGNWIDYPTKVFPEVDIEDAYAIGQHVTDLKVADGRVIKGHKVGYTSAAMRRAFGAVEPDYGTLFDDWFVDEGTMIDKSRLNLPWVEIELLFALKAPLGGPHVNAIDVIQATDFIVPAIEICDNRYKTDDYTGVIDSIADAASCGLVVVGGNPVRLTDVDPRALSGALFINGEPVESGAAAAVMGNPVNAVAWLARKLHSFGVTMQPGHSILSGSFIAARSIKPGDAILADFGQLGQVSFGVTS
ncbi:fumarylacetoacetate hydrolase family protein [Lentibacter algarum]|uniref:2-keto-4-pentenoate hydratase n=1 Tax=Lentibacter algarum TaxID=576131 RepID=UPI001C091091|nr:fumarylacetoacetate hydrolase family protein [Lentibacter algarum]MBU2983699.1 fumarylacetoacetate hydrolase family protein [Lentibacter algarum]